MMPIEHDDPINARILAISEDKIEGFVREPFQEIARRSGIDVNVVMARIAAMLRAGTIRRVRQTLLATNLADGALVAWKVPEDKIDSAFDWMFQRDPFSGHVVVRSTETASAGSEYKLWTTLKVPHGFSLQKHCELLTQKVGAEKFRIMPAKGIFTLGVGHVRRKTIEPGEKGDAPAKMIRVEVVDLGEQEWNILLALKRELAPEEIRPNLWRSRTAPTNNGSSITRPQAIDIYSRAAFPFPTPIFSGAGGARSNRLKFRRKFTGNGYARSICRRRNLGAGACSEHADRKAAQRARSQQRRDR